MFGIPTTLINRLAAPTTDITIKTTAPPRRAVTGSAQRLVSHSLTTVVRKTGQTQEQKDAWDAYGLVGEFWFLVNAIADKAAKARLFVARVPDSATATPVEVEDDPIASEVLASLLGDATEQQELIRRAVLNIEVCGEAWLIGISDDPQATLDTFDWYVMSSDEFRLSADEWVFQLPDGSTKTVRGNDGVVAVRIWRQHPRKAIMADAATSAALPVLRELIELTKSVSSALDSRLAGAGILVVAQSLQKSLQNGMAQADSMSVEYDDDGMPIQQPDDNSDPLTDSLIEVMSTAIKDQSSAAARVPIIVTAPDDTMQGSKQPFQHLTFSTPIDTQAKELREESIVRLAHSLNVPPELLTGLGDSTHWNSWLVQKDTIDSHVAPLLAVWCAGLTKQLLRPILEQNLGAETADKYMVWFDVSHLYTRPNQEANALNLYDRGELSGDALRHALGWDDSDSPEHMDPAVRVAIDMVSKTPALLTSMSLAELVEQIRDVIGDGTPSGSGSPQLTDGDMPATAETEAPEPS